MTYGQSIEEVCRVIQIWTHNVHCGIVFLPTQVGQASACLRHALLPRTDIHGAPLNDVLSDLGGSALVIAGSATKNG